MTLSRVVQVIDLRNAVYVIGSSWVFSFFPSYMSLVRKTSSLPFDVIDDCYIVSDTVDRNEKTRLSKTVFNSRRDSVIIKRQKLAGPRKKKEKGKGIRYYFLLCYQCVYSKPLLRQ